MNIFLHEQFIFIVVVFALFIIPGWFFLIAFFPHDRFAFIEKFVLSVPLSFALITLTIILINALGYPLSKTNITITLCSIIILLLGGVVRKKTSTESHDHIFSFSKKQTAVILLLLIFTIAIKSAFLINTIFPTATDLGHHMFWVEKITKEQALPQYEKISVITNTDSTTLSQPEDIADFIVGEHIIFAVIKTLTDQSTVSTFPSLVLFVISIFTVLMLFILTRRLFETYQHGDMTSILTLLFIGPLWAISGAGAKFVSGGVVGNIIGNLLIPTIIYFLYRAFYTKKATLLIPAIITVTALVYTHHLSTFIFGYIFIFSILAYIIFQKNGFDGYKRIFVLLKNYYILPLLIIALASIFVLHPPSYLDSDTVATSIGTPTKSTRTGIPFTQLMHMLGEARFVFGLIGFIMLGGFFILLRVGKLHHISKRSHPTTIYAGAFLLGWCGALLGMSMFPDILQVNIISSRIATYCIFPLAILSSLAIVWTVHILLKNSDRAFLVPQQIVVLFLLALCTYTFTTGMYDNATSMNPAPKTNSALQTFHAGNYASKVFDNRASAGDFWMIKDHNYITADTWIKVFFAYDYSYPLSRSFFKRYETNPDREKCTLHMISSPNSPEAKKCFEDLSTYAVMVNTEEDATQFISLDNFYRIYQNNEHSLFIRK